MTGTDLNGDNLLNLSELTNFSASSLLENLTVSLNDLVGFGSFDLLAATWNPNGISWVGQPDNAYFTWNNQGNSVNSTWATVEITDFNSDTTPIPTPALLPGLIGMGVAALRKREQEQTEATEVAEAAEA